MAIAEQDLPALEARVREVVDSLAGVLAYHAGGVVLEGISPEGRVRLRFTGMCSHCSLRPVTLASILRPALEGVDGITAVETVGLRLSEEAEQRLRGSIHPLQIGRRDAVSKS